MQHTATTCNNTATHAHILPAILCVYKKYEYTNQSICTRTYLCCTTYKLLRFFFFLTKIFMWANPQSGLIRSGVHCNTLQHMWQELHVMSHMCCSVLQCVLQCVAACCSVAVCGSVLGTHQEIHVMRQMCCSVLQCVAVCCSVLQSVAVCCSVWQSVAVCCSVLQCVAVCCSALQCVAACCSALQRVAARLIKSCMWQELHVCVCVCVCLIYEYKWIKEKKVMRHVSWITNVVSHGS